MSLIVGTAALAIAGWLLSYPIALSTQLSPSLLTLAGFACLAMARAEQKQRAETTEKGRGMTRYPRGRLDLAPFRPFAWVFLGGLCRAWPRHFDAIMAGLYRQGAGDDDDSHGRMVVSGAGSRRRMPSLWGDRTPTRSPRPAEGDASRACARPGQRDCALPCLPLAGAQAPRCAQNRQRPATAAQDAGACNRSLTGRECDPAGRASGQSRLSSRTTLRTLAAGH